MKVNRKKLELSMARACVNSADLPGLTGLPHPTVQNAIVGKGVRLSRKAQMAVRRLQERSNLPARQIVSEIIIQAEDLVDVDPPDD